MEAVSKQIGLLSQSFSAWLETVPRTKKWKSGRAKSKRTNKSKPSQPPSKQKLHQSKSIPKKAQGKSMPKMHNKSIKMEQDPFSNIHLQSPLPFGFTSKKASMNSKSPAGIRKEKQCRLNKRIM